MTSHITQLPAAGYIRQADLIGEKPCTKEQADANRLNGARPVRPRAGRVGIVPISGPTLWRKVKAGEFPAPVRLTAGTVAWRVEDVRAWIESRVR